MWLSILCQCNCLSLSTLFLIPFLHFHFQFLSARKRARPISEHPVVQQVNDGTCHHLSVLFSLPHLFKYHLQIHFHFPLSIWTSISLSLLIICKKASKGQFPFNPLPLPLDEILSPSHSFGPRLQFQIKKRQIWPTNLNYETYTTLCTHMRDLIRKLSQARHMRGSKRQLQAKFYHTTHNSNL